MSRNRRHKQNSFSTFILRNAEFIDTIDMYRFGFMRHTEVPGIKKISNPINDWAMEYDWEPIGEDILSKSEAENLKVELEEIMWNEHPRMLHPTYRLISPWNPHPL